MDRIFFKIVYKCITVNTSAIWQHAAHTTDLLLLDAKQELHKKAYLLMKNNEEFSGKVLENGQIKIRRINNMLSQRYECIRKKLTFTCIRNKKF